MFSISQYEFLRREGAREREIVYGLMSTTRLQVNECPSTFPCPLDLLVCRRCDGKVLLAVPEKQQQILGLND
jgi:hypothetical protein